MQIYIRINSKKIKTLGVNMLSNMLYEINISIIYLNQVFFMHYVLLIFFNGSKIFS